MRIAVFRTGSSVRIFISMIHQLCCASTLYAANALTFRGIILQGGLYNQIMAVSAHLSFTSDICYLSPVINIQIHIAMLNNIGDYFLSWDFLLYLCMVMFTPRHDEHFNSDIYYMSPMINIQIHIAMLHSYWGLFFIRGCILYTVMFTTRHDDHFIHL